MKKNTKFDITGVRFIDKEEEQEIEHYIVKAKISFEIGKTDYFDTIYIVSSPASSGHRMYAEFSWEIEEKTDQEISEKERKSLLKIKKELMQEAMSFYHQVLSTKREESDDEEEYDDE